MLNVAKEFIEINKQIDDLDQRLKELKVDRDSLNERLTQEMIDNEMQSLNCRGKILYLNTTLQASYNKEIQDKFFEVLEGHGYGALIKPTVNANTLKATVREMIEQNDGELPTWLDGMVTTFHQTKVNIKKA